jgi:hypothetical protein
LVLNVLLRQINYLLGSNGGVVHDTSTPHLHN